MGLIELGITFAIVAGIAKAFAGGGSGGKKKASVDDKKSGGIKSTKVPTGNPPKLPSTYDHTDWPSMRLQFTLLGYANNQYSVTRPTGAFVGQFQRDYNSVSAACLNNAFACDLGDVAAMGRLAVDKKGGPKVGNALEVAKRVQARTGKTWTVLVQQAHAAGF